jgi:sigma-B regulation protein RsbU (phosphoserine phosphatase)
MAAIVMDELELRLSAKTVVDREQTLRDHAERTTRALQESLLPPTLPEIPGIDLAALYRPAEASEVGGDFYDVFELDSSGHPPGWALVVGDVSGKGPAAAAVTALVRHTIRTASLSTDEPAEALETLNRAMFIGRTDGQLDHFCTVHLSFLRPSAGGLTLRTAAAGHPPALVMPAGRQPAAIAAPGPPVGWHSDARFETAETTLGQGDVVLVYTDGLSEARRGAKLLGEEELAGILEGARGVAAEAVADRLLETLSSPDVRARDDAAALVVRVR